MTDDDDNNDYNNKVIHKIPRKQLSSQRVSLAPTDGLCQLQTFYRDSVASSSDS